MNYFSNFSNYCIQNKNRIFIFLIFFHILISVSIFIFANTEYLSSFQYKSVAIWNDFRVRPDINYSSAIFWRFAADSFVYHIEAINAVDLLEKSLWFDWFTIYPDHQHVKLISLLYWITGYHSPIVYSVIIGSVVWATSLILIYRSSEMLFPDSNKVPLITSLFFLQPSLLIHSTQLLRDPLYTLGFILMCYGMIVVFKQKTKWKWIFIINAGLFLMIAMRIYLVPIFLMMIIIFSVLVFFQKRSSYLSLFILIVPLIFFQSVSVNKYISLDTIANDSVIDQSKYISTYSLPIKGISGLFINSSKGVSVNKNMYLLPISYTLSSKIKDHSLPSSSSFDSQENLKDELVDSLGEDNDRLITKDKIASHGVDTERDKKMQLKIIASQQERLKDNNKSSYLNPILSTFNKIAQQISVMRLGMRVGYLEGKNKKEEIGSFVDLDVYFVDIYDFMNYLPRASQIGFLSPFPVNWLNKGRQVGRIGSALAGMEMFILYIIFVGCIYILYKAPIGILPISVVFLLSIGIIILLSFTIPNIGAVYRLRQPYFIPFYLAGVQGLYLMLKNFNRVHK